MNTRLISHEFEYHAPQTLQEALELLSRYEPEAKILAGGTDLLVELRSGKKSLLYKQQKYF